MALKSGSSSFACVASYLSAPGSKRSCQLSFSQVPDDNKRYNVHQLRYARVKTCQYTHRMAHLKKKLTIFAISEDHSVSAKDEIYSPEGQNLDTYNEDIPIVNTSSSNHEEIGGKPGILSFYNRPYKKEDEILASAFSRNENRILWFIGPAILVASFIVPSLYLRKLISTVFEDSLLTDFLILFFTEALFYCGVAIYLVLIDHLRRPVESSLFAVNSSRSLAPQLGDRSSSVTVLVLSLIIPMATMGLVWPWTGPAASATLAPYLVGIVVQFAFEQYARYKKSPSWPTIPIIFQIYRLHQLNRAAQLVTALLFTVRGAEMTSHNVAINNSLSALLNILQVLGVICIWSLSSFVMRFFPSRLNGRRVD